MTGPAFDVVVLAGGASRRMGWDKAVLELEGRRLVDRLAERMGLVASRVVVASGERSLGRDDEVPDAPRFTGPMAGLVAGLHATDAAYVACVPVDAPLTTPDLVRRLVDLAHDRDALALVPVADDHLQALHAVLARRALPAIEARLAAGERSPRRLLGWLDAVRVDVDGWADLDPTGAFARDWDRPEDLPADVSLPR